MIATTCAQQPYFIAPITRKHILKIAFRHLPKMQINHPTNLVFIQEKLARKQTASAPRYLRSLICTLFFELSSGYLRSFYLFRKREKREREIDAFNKYT